MGYILIADDDLAIAELIEDSLLDEGYATKIVTSGDAAIQIINEESNLIDLILLDIMLPGKSGYDVCQSIRHKTDVPIVFVSAKSSDQSKILGLNIGADDYITKPFIIAELVARVNAHIRREQRRLNIDTQLIKVGNISIDTENELVYLNDQLVDLSNREFHVLLYLSEHIGKVLTREQIYEHVWQTKFGDLNSVTIHIKNIRAKLDPNNELIRTVWGVGYKLVRGNMSCL